MKFCCSAKNIYINIYLHIYICKCFWTSLAPLKHIKRLAAAKTSITHALSATLTDSFTYCFGHLCHVLGALFSALLSAFISSSSSNNNTNFSNIFNSFSSTACHRWMAVITVVNIRKKLLTFCLCFRACVLGSRLV